MPPLHVSDNPKRFGSGVSTSALPLVFAPRTGNLIHFGFRRNFFSIIPQVEQPFRPHYWLVLHLLHGRRSTRLLGALAHGHRIGQFSCQALPGPFEGFSPSFYSIPPC